MHKQRRGAGRALIGLMSAFIVVSCGDSSDPSSSNISSVSFSASTVSISQAESRILGLAVKDASGNVLTDVAGIEWTSSNTAVLSVSQSGEVHGVALGGPVSVTAGVNGLTATATATVVPARVAFSPPDSNIVLGTTVQLSAAMLDHAGAPINSTSDVVWTSSNPGVATIGSSSGLVTTTSSGEAVISATARGRTDTRRIRVGVPTSYDGRWSGASTAVSGRDGGPAASNSE